ncbi:MAG: hypothetical protein HN530_01355 [Gammaproteobacteria bacterium]|jgi:hypothetical protein|nr:hypothetical protein [Gammaproteobacteria bacterium]
MRTKQNKLLGELMAGAFIIFWFLISYLLSYQSINALISPISNLMTVVPFLIFLPHGVRVIAVYFLGYKAVLPLFIAQLLLYQLFENMPPNEVHIPLAAVGALSPLIAFELLRVCDLKSYYRPNPPDAMPNTVGPPLLAGILAAIFNGLLTLAILLFNESPVANLNFLLGYLIGDLLGFLVILGLIVTVRNLRDSLKNNHNNS